MADIYHEKLDKMTIEELYEERKTLTFSLRNAIDSMFSFSSGDEFRKYISQTERDIDYINSLIQKKVSGK